MSAAAAEGLTGALDWLAVDWGTSSLRVWAMAEAGQVSSQVSSQVLGRCGAPLGMGKLTPEAFEPTLRELVSPWLDGAPTPLPVVICGMAGAREGWIEAPYQEAPCAPLGAKLAAAPSVEGVFEAVIIPGVKQADPPDVMRGEETQIAGWLAENPDFEGALCLPGTHSKWVEVRGREVAGFSTFLTGELFELLSAQSVLRHSVGGEGLDKDKFAEGVRDALGAPEAVIAELFTIRARSLLQRETLEQGRGRLSGLLIGAEIEAAAGYWREGAVVVLAEPPLAELYREALALAGVRDVTVASSKAAVLAGLTAAFQQRGAG